ncbi:MAG TPA: DUF4058 family protein [Thermoguttaceae bacterium]|nr:DUF4058 family protein [Thermoguttaceae bacterium]
MPVHDWTRVEAGVFHAFHHGWIEETSRALNGGILPPEYYALPEQHAVGFGPDVLTLQGPTGLNGETPEKGDEVPAEAASEGGVSVLLSPPRARLTAETDMEFYRRKQKAVVVRHVSGDRMVAVVEVVSPGNKAGRSALRSFVEKAAGLLDQRIHLLILDLHPPTPRDPQGIHGAIWEEISGQEYTAPSDQPLTLAAYESGLTVRAYVEPVAVGSVLAEMPLFLEPGAHVLVPLESTYGRAFAAMPRRWRVVLEEA